MRETQHSGLRKPKQGRSKQDCCFAQGRRRKRQQGPWPWRPKHSCAKPAPESNEGGWTRTDSTIRKRLHFLSRSTVSLFYNGLLSTRPVPQAGPWRQSQRACHKQASPQLSGSLENLCHPHTKCKSAHTKCKNPHTKCKSSYFAGARREEKLIILSKPTTKGWPIYLPSQNPLYVFSTLPGCYFRMLGLSVVQIEHKHRVYSEK